MPTERLTFTGHAGDALSARLDRPDGPILATALLAHCFTCGKDIAAARRIAARLSAMGFAVLRFDFTGLGHSEGEFANTTFSSNAQDLVAAADHLRDMGLPPSLLIGHSLGGAAVLRAAGDIPDATAVVTIGAPFDPAHVTHAFGDALDRIDADGRAEVDLGGRPITIGRDFLRDVSAAALAPRIAELSRALLVLHAPRDAVVDIDNAAQIFMAAKHPKSFVTLDDADHLVSAQADADYAADVIAAWAGRYIALDPPPATEDAPEGVVRVSESDPDGFRQDIQNGPHHHAVADEPRDFGGTGAGMSPYGFVSAGLGACTAMTIRMYARRKGWPLDHVAVDVTHDKVHVHDADSAQDAKVDRFTRHVTLRGALSTEQSAALMAIADKCPVHRTLEHGAQIVTERA